MSKSMVRSMVRSMIKSMARSMVRTHSISRYFLDFDPVLNSYGELAEAWTPSGDLEIEMDFASTAATGRLLATPNPTTDGFEIYANATQLVIRLSSSSVQQYLAPLFDALEQH